MNFCYIQKGQAKWLRMKTYSMVDEQNIRLFLRKNAKFFYNREADDFKGKEIELLSLNLDLQYVLLTAVFHNSIEWVLQESP